MSVNKARIASELLGLGGGGGVLQRLTISPERGDRIEALFNPNEITVSSAAMWEEKKPASHGPSYTGEVGLEFRSVEAKTLSVDLFFDTYESRTAASFKSAITSLLPSVPSPREATNVRHHTDQVARLADVDRELHRPPACALSWGELRIFEGVLTSLQQRFTLFLEDGTPVRATLTCSFLGVSTEAQRRAGETQSSDVAKTRRVRRNDTLHSIAAEEYRDPSLWRHIARANGIVNPRDLKPGTVLTIPRLGP